MRRRPQAEPQRTCIGCRRVTGQSQLVRLVRTPDDELTIGRHEPGRGAWLCRDSVPCLDEALGRRACSRTLGREPRPAEEQALRARLVPGPDETGHVPGT